MEKPYKCDQCDYACSDPSALIQHLKRHSGERPFNCNQCNYASSQAVHLMTHCRDKPNKCNRCKFACLQPSILRTYMCEYIWWRSQRNAISVIMNHLVQVAWWHIRKSTTERIHTNGAMHFKHLTSWITLTSKSTISCIVCYFPTRWRNIFICNDLNFVYLTDICILEV